MSDTNQNIDADEFERKKKMATFLPVIIIPILVAFFWLMGGGKGSSTGLAAEGQPGNQLNTELPKPIVDRDITKKQSYDRVRDQEAKRDYDLSQDPYAALLRDSSDIKESIRSGVNDWETGFSSRTSNLEEEMAAFSAELDNAQSSTQSRGTSQRSNRSAFTPRNKPASTRYDNSALSVAEEDAKVRELELAIAGLNSTGGSPYDQDFPPPGAMSYGPDMGGELVLSAEDSMASAQLQTLDRIMERATLLQHPELFEDELKAKSAKNAKKLFPVSEASAAAGDVKVFGVDARRDTVPPRRVRRTGGGFFTGDSDAGTDDFEQYTVRAQIHSSATVMDGSTVKMRLLEDVYVAGRRIPVNTFVYGQVRLQGDRLAVQVETITYRNNIYDVGLNVYDLDGQFGLAVPGSIERQIAKREASNAARNLGAGNGGGRNLTAQIAADGAETIRQIASRKVTVIKVDLKAGHQVILRNQ